MSRKLKPDDDWPEYLYKDSDDKAEYFDDETEEYFPLEESKPPHY